MRPSIPGYETTVRWRHAGMWYVVRVGVSAYYDGRLSGPPDECREAEGGEAEPLEVLDKNGCGRPDLLKILYASSEIDEICAAAQREGPDKYANVGEPGDEDE